MFLHHLKTLSPFTLCECFMVNKPLELSKSNEFYVNVQLSAFSAFMGRLYTRFAFCCQDLIAFNHKSTGSGTDVE